MLPVQVIGQQWEFTFRYPTYGGVETAELVLPVNREIEFHVTSLDVIHSFWAYELGVKADANPGVDNVAYVKAKTTGDFQIRCAELCGLWHGYMFDTGRVVDDAQFTAWIAGQRKQFTPVQKYLPPYSLTYSPDPAGARRMKLRRLLGYNLLTAVVLGIVGFYVGWWLGHLFKAPEPRLLRRHRPERHRALPRVPDLASSASSSGSASRATRSSGCSASHRHSARRRPRARDATSVSAPTTRSSGCST